MKEQGNERQTGTGIRHTVVGALRSPGKILGARKHAQPREQAFHDQAYKRVTATTGSIAPDASHSVAPAVKPAARRRTSQEAAVVVATPAKRDRVVTETVYTAPKTDSRSVDKTPRRQRRKAAAAAYAANEEVAAEEDRVVVAEVDRDNHGNGRHVNWTALSGLAIAGAIVWTGLGLRGNGGAPVASASSSPDNSGHPTDSLKPSASPSAAASASETVLNVNNLNVQTLISLFKLNPSLFQAFQADGYALDPNNLSIIYDKDSNVPGVIIKDDETTGLSHLIATLNSKDLSTVAQGYWDAKLPLTKDPNLNHQAISFALAPGNLLPAKEVTEWAVDQNQTLKDATDQATKGQAKLEAGTQPNVCTLEITKTIQAVDGNEQTVKPDNWEAEKLTPDQAASLYGRDAYSEKAINWKATPDGFGMIIQKPEDGTNTIIDTVNAVAQVYWDVKMPNSVSEGHQVVAGTLAPNVTAPVREATVYKIPDAVVENVKDDAALNTWAKHVNLEINGLADPNSGQTPDLNKIQKGVYVALVTDSVCPLPSNSTTTAEATASATPTAKPTKAEIKAKATAAATEIANTPWYKQFVDSLPAGTTSVLADGGLKIKENTPKNITVPDGYEIHYWDGQKTVILPGPIIVSTGEATIYKIK